MIRSFDHSDRDPWQGLTAKQCQVLDLLIEHQTSKEISRKLGISPHTVDQRILLARAKLQVTTRNEVAQAYRRLLSATRDISKTDICERSIYGSSDLATVEKVNQTNCREALDSVIGVASAGQSRGQSSERSEATVPLAAVAMAGVPAGMSDDGYHVLPAMFDGRGGTLLRLGTIALITVCLTLIIIGGLTMYVQLAHIFDG